MAFGDIAGRARTDPSSPSAFGVCDDCGEFYNLNDLQWQMQWHGPVLSRTGYRKCPRCLDVPQPQLKPVILPPDPIPVKDPRIELLLQDYGLQFFSQYGIDAEQPNLTKSQVLAAASAFSAIPGTLNDYSGSISTSGVAQSLLPSNPSRTFILIYNPAAPTFGVSEATATYVPPPPNTGQPTTIWNGAGSMLIMSTSTLPSGPPVYTGPMTIIGLIPGVPFYAWDGE